MELKYSSLFVGVFHVKKHREMITYLVIWKWCDYATQGSMQNYRGRKLAQHASKFTKPIGGYKGATWGSRDTKE